MKIRLHCIIEHESFDTGATKGMQIMKKVINHTLCAVPRIKDTIIIGDDGLEGEVKIVAWDSNLQNVEVYLRKCKVHGISEYNEIVKAFEEDDWHNI